MTQFVLYGGKGGVGKTTCASATALKLAQDDYKTLVVSTDPAHSIADVFDREVGSEPTRVIDNHPVFAVEVDPEHRFNENYADTFDALTNEAKNFGVDVTSGLDIDTDGIIGSDEMAVVDVFAEYMESDEWDYIIFDTAPTGHTLRMLRLPDVLDSAIGKVLDIKSQFGSIADTVSGFIGGGSDDDEPDISDVDIDETKNKMRRVADVLQNPDTTRFRVVMEAEKLSMLETERLLAQLDEYDIHVDGVVANKILTDIDETCTMCSNRRDQQQEILKTSATRFDVPIVQVPRLQEPNGDDSLETVATSIIGEG